MVMLNKSHLEKPGSENSIISTPNDGEVHLTPKATSTGVEGTIFYCSADKQVYVGIEADIVYVSPWMIDSWLATEWAEDAWGASG